MQTTIHISAIGIGIIFFAGVVIGWLMSRVRLLGNVNISVQRGDPASGERSTFVVAKTVRSMSLKCQCGSTWKFHETGGHADEGSQPMPSGDAFTCPNCGRSIDLKPVREAGMDALASG
jgi:hypothetical protein